MGKKGVGQPQIIHFDSLFNESALVQAKIVPAVRYTESYRLVKYISFMIPRPKGH